MTHHYPIEQTVSQVIENQPRHFIQIQNILASIGLSGKFKPIRIRDLISTNQNRLFLFQQ